jgi:SAM-dependent methyltransferase
VSPVDPVRFSPMADEEARAGASRTRTQWEGFAQQDPTLYILGHGEARSPEEFLESGREIVDSVVQYLGEDRLGGRMLEIGCGLGRTVQAFAPHFDEVVGVDISPTMVEQARQLHPPANVRFSTISGADISDFGDDHFDFVFSFVVFQHVNDGAVISGLLRDIARAMKPGGAALLQFDTRPKTLPVRIAFALPDRALPPLHRRGIRRVRRSRAWLLREFSEVGLRVVDERDRWMKSLAPGATSAFHHFVLASDSRA